METFKVEGNLGYADFGDIDLDDPMIEGDAKLEQDVAMGVLDGRFNTLVSLQASANADSHYLQGEILDAVTAIQNLQKVSACPGDEAIGSIDQVTVDVDAADPRYFRFFVSVTSEDGVESALLTGRLPATEG